MTNNAAIAIGNGAITPITFGIARFDPFLMHSVTKIIIPRTGNYNVGGCIEFAAAGGGYRQIGVRRNGTTFVVQTTQAPTGVADQLNVACDWQFTAGDYIELVVVQNSGGPLNVNAVGDYTPEFWCCRVFDQPV